MPERTTQPEAISFGGWPARREMVARRIRHPETRRELLEIEDAFHGGDIDQTQYELEHLRLAGRTELRDHPLRRKFPTGRAVEAFAVAKNEGQKIQRHTLAANGIAPFLRWYEPIADRFGHLIRTIRGLRVYGTGSADEDLVERLVTRGNDMAAFYRDAKSVKEIPYLPPFQGREKRVGTDHECADVLDVWEMEVGSTSEPQPQQSEWVPVQGDLL